MHLSSMPAWLIGPIIVLSSLAVSIAGVYVVRRMRWYPVLQGHSEFVDHVYAVIGLIYGVFLAFTIIIAWQQYSEAERSATNEVSNVSMLWRDAQVFPLPIRNQIQDRLIAYSKAVVESEWSSMAAEGWKSKSAGDAYEEIWRAYYDFHPQTETEKAFYNESLGQLNDLGIQRRVRLMYSRSQLPVVLWLFLIIGAIVTTGFPYLFWTKHPKLQSLIIAALAGLISSSLFLTLSLQHPFTGDVSIKPEAFQLLTKSLEERKQDQMIKEAEQTIEQKKANK
jgi:Protein of unknown function (DUF4239)